MHSVTAKGTTRNDTSHFMVGARGAGKTTVGSALAQALGYRFIDTDLFMQQTTQMSVADMVAQVVGRVFASAKPRPCKR